MRAMKDSGIPWIGKIPEDWHIERIKYLRNGEVDSFQDGDWIESPYITDSGIRYLTTGNVGDGFFKEQGNGFITEKTFIELGCKYAYPGDLVISRLNAPYGRACILPNTEDKYVLAVDNVILRTDHIKKYLCYLMQCDGYQNVVQDGAKGTTMKRISRTNLGNVSLPIPSIHEQQQIAGFLDTECARIDAVMEQTRASIEEYKKLKQSIITEAVTKGIRPNRPMKDSGIDWIEQIPADWEISKIKYVSVFQPSCDTSSISKDSTITYTPMECIKNGYFINNAATFGSVAASLIPFSNGDIVIAKVTPCFENGNIAIMDNLYSGFGLGSSELFVLRPESIKTRFLFYWLQNNLFMQQACSTMTGTGGLKRVSPYFIRNCPVTLPHETEQNEICAFLDAHTRDIDLLISKKERSLSDLEAYKKSLIYEYVTGKKEVGGNV